MILLYYSIEVLFTVGKLKRYIGLRNNRTVHVLIVINKKKTESSNDLILFALLFYY